MIKEIDITLPEIAEELDLVIIGLTAAVSDTQNDYYASRALMRFMALRELLQCLPDLLGTGSVLTMSAGKIEGFHEADGTVKN